MNGRCRCGRRTRISPRWAPGATRSTRSAAHRISAAATISCRRLPPRESTSARRYSIEYSRRVRLTRQPRLRGKADRRIGGAETAVAAPLDDLEEKPVLEARRIKLQIFGV